jgi:alkanesulfonate monooxygenase SsuD/methylene tetrahydromethanopterin reductase-like flavin-dependent oxidoreductase (luciferase family)
VLAEARPGPRRESDPAALDRRERARLNEHVIGAGWPGRGERHERLAEATDIILGLLAGELTNYPGKHFRLDHARLFDRPDTQLAVVIAAGRPEAARLAGRKGDGLIATAPRPELIAAFEAAGGSGPRYAEVALCCAEREEDAQETAHRYFAVRSPAGRCRRSCPIPKDSRRRASTCRPSSWPGP